jgi:hypothetical protein
MSECGIDAIDFLKFDTEGSDIDVLRGFRHVFERGAMAIVQFEHNYLSPFNRPPGLVSMTFLAMAIRSERIGRVAWNSRKMTTPLRTTRARTPSRYGLTCIDQSRRRHDLFARPNGSNVACMRPKRPRCNPSHSYRELWVV